MGLKWQQKNSSIRKDAFWFGEAQGRVVVTVKPENIKNFETLLNIPFEKLGIVTSGTIIIDKDNLGNISDWSAKYDNAIGNYFKNYMPE